MSTWYVSFGVQYGDGKNQERHPLGFSCDGWVEIEADDELEARAIAFRWLGRQWSMMYSEESFDRSWHPAGCQGRARLEKAKAEVLLIDMNIPEGDKL